LSATLGVMTSGDASTSVSSWTHRVRYHEATRGRSQRRHDGNIARGGRQKERSRRHDGIAPYNERTSSNSLTQQRCPTRNFDNASTRRRCMSSRSLAAVGSRCTSRPMTPMSEQRSHVWADARHAGSKILRPRRHRCATSMARDGAAPLSESRGTPREHGMDVRSAYAPCAVRAVKGAHCRCAHGDVSAVASMRWCIVCACFRLTAHVRVCACACGCGCVCA
jgi:hypothetical protein